MKAYKAMNKDHTCRGFKFEEGETYEVEGSPVLCEHGFHFCKDLVLTLQYYPVDQDINENVYAEIEILGEVELEKPTGHKGVTNKLKVLRFISPEEIATLIIDGNSNSGRFNSGDYNSGRFNSGHYNSGRFNSGDYNSGHYNSGRFNSGHYNSGRYNSGNSNSGRYNSGNSNSGRYNSGNSNSGNWNSCDCESGHFNSKQSETIRIFNKPCLRDVWEQAHKPNFLYFDIDTDLGYRGSFRKAFDRATPQDIALLKALPNFDAGVFFGISGIRVE